MVRKDSGIRADTKGFQIVRSSYKTIGLWVILIILFVAFYNFFSHSGESVRLYPSTS